MKETYEEAAIKVLNGITETEKVMETLPGLTGDSREAILQRLHTCMQSIGADLDNFIASSVGDTPEFTEEKPSDDAKLSASLLADYCDPTHKLIMR